METFSALLAFCAGNSSVFSGFPLTKAIDAELWCFFDLSRNQQLSKQWRRQWYETPSHPLWRHCNAKGSSKLHITGPFWGNPPESGHLKQVVLQKAFLKHDVMLMCVTSDGQFTDWISPRPIFSICRLAFNGDCIWSSPTQNWHLYTVLSGKKTIKKPAANGNGAGFYVRWESMWSLGVDTVRFWHNIMRPRQSGRHFTDDILKFAFQYVYRYIVIQVWLKCVVTGPINNKTLLVQIMILCDKL